MAWGFYKRGDEDQPVVLMANPEDRAAYEAKGLVHLGPAPSPGTSTPEETAAALKKLAPKPRP